MHLNSLSFSCGGSPYIRVDPLTLARKKVLEPPAGRKHRPHLSVEGGGPLCFRGSERWVGERPRALADFRLISIVGQGKD
jgi:hypothetical protein